MRHKLSIAAAFSLLGACAPALGDGCKTSTECSANGDRFCDRSQPGGYCTIANCEPKSCTEEGYCVRFEPDDPRRSSDWCMKKCKSTGDCDRDEYVCRSAADLNEPEQAALNPESLRRAEVLDDNKDGKFCVARSE